MAAVNGDGFFDIYVYRSNYLDRKGANQLFINNGDWKRIIIWKESSR